MKIANKEYGKFLNEIKSRIVAARIKAVCSKLAQLVPANKSICILLIIILNSSLVISPPAALCAALRADHSYLPAGTASFADEYHLAPCDQLEIKIIGQKDMDTKQSIAPDGTISLPLIGRVTAQGQTLGDFNKYLSDKFSKYIKNPRVVVYLTPRPIYIVQHDKRKNAWEVKEAKSIAEANAYMGVSTSDLPVRQAGLGHRTSDIKHGDVVTVDISKKPDFFEDNWYKIITGSAVLVGIYLSLHK